MSSRRTRASGGSGMSGLFTFALIGLFAILSLLVAVIGVRAYQSVIEINGHNNDTRASLSYISNKVRTGDEAGAIRIEEKDGIPMVSIEQVVEDELFVTQIYFFENALWEQSSTLDDEYEFDPEYGEYLVDIGAFEVTQPRDGLIAMSITTLDGTTHTMHMAVRSAQGGS